MGESGARTSKGISFQGVVTFVLLVKCFQIGIKYSTPYDQGVL